MLKNAFFSTVVRRDDRIMSNEGKAPNSLLYSRPKKTTKIEMFVEKSIYRMGRT